MAPAQEKFTQDDRILRLETPLGKDFFLIDSISGTESISHLFSFQIEARRAEAAATPVDPVTILGQPVSVELAQRDERSKRHFHGIVSRFSQGGRDECFTYFRMEVVPWLWLLTRTKHSRIFQQLNVPEIIKKVFEDSRFDFTYKIETERTYYPRNYCVQYRESDFNFVSRLMEEEGIFYYFEHKPDSHTMIIADDPGSHRPCSKSKIEFESEISEDKLASVVNQWSLDYELQPGKVLYWDHNFGLGPRKLEADIQSPFNKVNNHALEIYEYPGGYAKKFDGIAKDGGEQSANLENVFQDNEQVAHTAMQALDVKYKTFVGSSDVASFTAGHEFTIDKLLIPDQNGKFALKSVSHLGYQTPGYGSDDGNDAPYRNTFVCIPIGKDGAPPFRPEQITPKPVVQGSQTGYVVGPGGEEIFTDKYGRVKVQLHWDRDGRNDAGSSCWMRVAQGWAGKQWGMINIPRIGTEVIVHFLEGDPDQPIVSGCLYNPEAMPPYELPDNKTRSAIKTNSSPGGDGFNEIRFEDEKGNEQIFIHAERNEDIRVKKECAETIGANRSLTVGGDQMEKVDGDKHLDVGSAQNEKIGGSYSRTVGGSVDQKVGPKYALESSGEIHLKAGMKVVIEAGVQLSLKGPGGFIDIGPAGVTIQGTMVRINSGGGAGAGSGASPKSPDPPKEADNAESGRRLEKPPPPPTRISPAATILKGASSSGAPLATGGAPPAGSPPSPEEAQNQADQTGEMVEDSEGAHHMPTETVETTPSPEQAQAEADETGEMVQDSEGAYHMPEQDVSADESGGGAGGGGGAGAGGDQTGGGAGGGPEWEVTPDPPSGGQTGGSTGGGPEWEVTPDPPDEGKS